MNDLACIYVDMKQEIIKAGFANEIDWQEDRVFDDVTEQEFIREAAWVVISAGLSEKVVRKIFGGISEAFFGWESAEKICHNSLMCRRKALNLFGNERKISAIIKVAEAILSIGYTAFHGKVEAGGTEYIKTLPFMGPATSYHLAKNIGLNTAKPDRHLLRIAKKVNFDCPITLCRLISDCVGDTIAVVDLVLWRFATLKPNYLEYFPSKAVTD